MLGLIALLLGLALAAPRVVSLLTHPVPGEEEAAEGTAPKPAAEGDDPGSAQRRIDVKLFFQSAGAPGLVIEDRPVPYAEELSQQLRHVIEALVAGPKGGGVATLPPETRVLDVFVGGQGVAYVDLSGEASAKHAGGSGAELMSVYSVVNSLTSNFPAVKRVQILIDDKPAATLAGHVNLGRPLFPDMTLLLLDMPTPAGAIPPAPPAPRP